MLTKRLSTYVVLILAIFAANMAIFAQEHIEIKTEEVELKVGESLQIDAVYVNNEGLEIDTTFGWSVQPANLGTFSGTEFTASRKGKGKITAKLNNLEDNIDVEIEKADNDNNQNGDPHIEIKNSKIKLNIGETKQLEVVYIDAEGDKTDTTATWTVEPDSLASVDQDALLTALKEGEGTLTATLDGMEDDVELEIEGEDDDDEDGKNTFPRIQIKNGKVKLNIGETKQLEVIYIATDSTETDTIATWTVEPDSLASVDQNALLTALKEGEGTLTATLDGLEDDVELEIEGEDEDDDEKDKDLPRIKIFNKKMDLEIGDSEQMRAIYLDVNGDTLDVDLSWFVNPGYLGSIDASLLFTAEHPGKGHIIVRYDTIEARVRLKIDGEDDDDEDTDLPNVKILTGDIKVAMADSVQLLAVYTDSSGVEADTVITWSVNPALLGSFSSATSGLFYAGEEGKGYISAAVGEYSDFVEIKVQVKEEESVEEYQYGRLIIVPRDTTVEVGAVIPYEARWSFQGALSDTTVDEWSLHGIDIGSITEEGGVLTATSPGVAFIKAELDDAEATAQITVVDVAGSTPDANTVQFSRVLPGGHILPAQIIREGEAYRIGGLPSPLNVLNDGLIYFPAGSLTEDITIHMLLPNTAQVGDSTVAFSDSSVAAVRFIVMVGDSVAEPYYFGVPLQLAIPFNQDLLDKLGLTATDLGLFFANASGDYLDDGLANIIVDSTANKIYAEVAHFSTLVVRGKSQTTSDVNLSSQAPQGFNLGQNYPNPFNPVTEIQYKLSSPEHVSILIYNALGQKVATLIDEQKIQGNYYVNWNAIDVSSGVYFYTLFIDGKPVMTKKMLFLK
ncbi:Ig-like domain-containing protein [bacterium]|nr:Ig-like domain-containing protein [bacterium]